MPPRTDRKPGVQDPNVKTEGELADDFDSTRQEINDRYQTGHPTDANAPPSTGGRLPSVASDRVGPGKAGVQSPTPAQGATPGVAGPDGLRGGVRIDLAGELVDDRGVPLPAGEAARVLSRLKERYDLAAAANALTDETPVPVSAGKSAQPSILAAALASVRKSVTTLAAITGCKDSDTPYVQGRGDGHSDELDEGEQAAPFNDGPAKSLPAAVQKTISALRSVRKAAIPMLAVAQTPARGVVNPANPHAVGADVSHLVRKGATGVEAEADVAAAALGGRAGVELGSGYNALGDRTPQVRRDGGLSAALQEIDASRLQLQHTGGRQMAQAGLGDGLTKQGSGAGRLGSGQARVADGAHSGGSGHHGGGRGGGKGGR
jgi:hypothetical protein